MIRNVISTAALLSLASAASAQFYSTQAEFTSHVATPFFLDTFASVGTGSISTYSNSGSGFGYSASATNGLWGLGGILSTNTATDPLVFDFSSSPTPVTAFGGNFWGTDIDGATIPATVTFTTAGGATFSYDTSSSSSFLGYVGATPLVSVSIATSAAGVNAWPTADNVILATAVPEPGAMVLSMLGVAGLALALRRQRRI